MTIDDLLTFFKNNNINERYYSLDGKLKDDAYHLREKANKWKVFYYERGKESQNIEFNNIEEALIYIYNIFNDAISKAGKKAFPN